MSIIFNYNKISLVLFFLFIYSFINATEKLENSRLIIIGDSLIQGYGLPKDKGFVNQLQKKLLEKKVNILLINGGVSGDTTAGGLSRIDWSITDDINAVAISLGANDMLRGINTDLIKQNLNNILEILREKNIEILLAGMLSQETYGNQYKNNFDEIYPELANKHKVAFLPFLLEGVALNPNLNLDDGKHPNPKGVKLISKNLEKQLINLLTN